MWTRKELKDRAKNVLRTSYWKAFLVSLLLALVSGGVQSGSFNSRLNGREGSNNGISMNLPGFIDGMNSHVLTLLIIGIILIVLAGIAVLAFNIFLRAPLEVSVSQYFKQAAQDDVNMNYLGHAFTKGKYLFIVKGMLWKNILNFLWFLLLIIPGIVKCYSYSMVPYILADNPDIGTNRAVELSNRMTRGEKWHMFVLDLSFIGWYLLGSLVLFVGVLFVLPYFQATKAELYLVLRQQALDEGLSSRTELNLSELV